MTNKQHEIKNYEKSLKPTTKEKPSSSYPLENTNKCTTKATIVKQNSIKGNLNSAATVKRHIIELSDNKVLKSIIQQIFKNKNSSYCKQYTLDILSHMLMLQDQNYQPLSNDQSCKAAKFDEKNQQKFSSYVNVLLDICYQAKLSNSLYACINYFYNQFKLKNDSVEECEAYVITSLFTASKYFQIYPPWLNELIEIVNSYLSQQKILQYQSKLLMHLQFKNFYQDSQQKWLQILGVILGLNKEQMIKCRFILDSGLTSIKLHRVKPSHKALSAISFYLKKSKQQISISICKQIIKISDEQLNRTQKLYRSSILFNRNTQIKSVQSQYFQDIGNYFSLGSV